MSVNGSFRSTLVSTTSAIALAAVSAMPAFAADQQAQGGGVQLEEIIVNARRVDENVQRVPIAVAAFSPEKLQQQDVKDIFTLTKNIGGLNICCSPGNTSYIFLRGIGNGTPAYFADVPVPTGGYANFFDISSAQVLKGPQGTLFGQASNAGALVYQPRKPGDVLGGYVTVTGGNYGRRSIEGALDVPVVEDKVLFRMAAQSYYREGFVEDVRTEKFLGDQNYYILRPSLIVRPTDDIENYSIFQLTKSKGTVVPYVLSDFNFSSQSLNGGPLAGDIRNTQASGNIGSVPPAGFASSRAAFDALRQQVLARQIQLGPYKVDGYSSGCSTPLGAAQGPGADPFAAFGVGNGGSGPITNLDYARASCQAQWQRDIFFSNTTTWNFADKLSLKNIFGYRNSHSFAQPGDTDGTPLIVFDQGSARNNLVNHGTPVWSDEIQLQGTKLFDFLDFTVGTFHTGQANKPVLTYAYLLGVQETLSQTKNSEHHRGVYGQGNVDLGYFNDALSGLTFTGGYRYTWDAIKQTTYNYDATSGAQLAGAAGTQANQLKTSQGAYTVGFQYQYTPDIMFFVTNSKGSSAGGLQNVLGKETYQPDSLNNIEGGIKGTFDIEGIKVRANASYYYGWYDNVKVSVTQLAQKFQGGQASLIVVTENAAKGNISGIDSDFTVIPTDWLELGGMFAYTKTKYTNWMATNVLGNPVDLSGTPFSFAPKYKWSLRGTVHLPVDQASMGDMSMTANYTHTGVMFNVAKPFTPSVPGNPNTGIVTEHCRTIANGYGVAADGKCVPVDKNPAYHNLDLSFDWKDVMGHEGLSSSVFVTNVTKNLQNDGGCYCDVALGVTSPIPAVPRMFGVRVGYAF